MALPSELQQALARLKQGPIEVRFDPTGTAVNVYPSDGIDISFVRGQEEQSVDTLGVYDLISSGDSANFELNCPEPSYNALKVLFADQVDGTSYVGFGETAGTSARATAQKVEIRPWQDRAAETFKVTFWVVVPEGDGSFGMSPTDPASITQSFRALPDPTQTDGSLIGQIVFPSRS